MRVHELDGVLQCHDVNFVLPFILLSIAASVVVLPEPVAPVTKMMPVFSLIISRKTGCSPSLSMVGISELSFRMTMA